MNKTIGIPKIDSAFKIGIILLVIKTMTASSLIIGYNETVDTMLSVVAALSFVISILQKRFPPKILMIYLLIVLMALYTVLRLHSLFVFLVVITCLALRRENIHETIRIMLFYGSVWFILHTAAAIWMSFWGEPLHSVIDGQTRYHFGYSHPNTFAMVLTNLTVMWVWVNYDRINVRSIVGILVVHLISYSLTTCRTALFAWLATALLLAIFYRREKRRKLLTAIAAVGVPLIALAIYGLMRMYLAGHPIAYVIDELLSGRIKLGAYALEYYGLSFWGQDLTDIIVVWDSDWRLSGHTFDNVYSYLMCSYGIVWLLVLVFLFYRLALIGDEKTNIMIILWMLYGISEVQILDPYRFFPIMLVATLYEHTPPKRKRRFRFTWRAAKTW